MIRFCLLVVPLLVALIAGGSSADILPGPPASDPWYYTSAVDWRFMTPDKFQHYYGSFLLAQLCGPSVAIAAGIAWEYYQAAGGFGFSRRDLVADVLGVASALVCRSDRLKVCLNWRQNPRELVLCVAWRFF